MKVCSHEGCENSFKDHRWGSIKAHSDGWFMERYEDRQWCPEHLPDWVPAWRESKKRKSEEA